MNKIDCSIIQDMIPLYIDKICSTQTQEMVAEHLETCEQCRQMLVQLEKPMPIKEAAEISEHDGKELYQNIRNSFMKKVIKRVLVIIAVIFAVVIAGGILWFAPVVNISYEDAAFEVVEYADKDKVYVDSIVKGLHGIRDGERFILSGKTSWSMICTSKTGIQNMRYPVMMDENLTEIIYQDSDGVEYVLWTR